MKLSGDTKITIKVPKRLYEQIKRQLNEEYTGYSPDDTPEIPLFDDYAWNTIKDELENKGLDPEVVDSHIKTNKEKLDKKQQSERFNIEDMVDFLLNPKEPLSIDSELSEDAEKVTMEELFEAVKQIKAKKKKEVDAKKKMTEATKIATAAQEKKAKIKAKKLADEKATKLAKEKEAKKKMAEAKKK